MIDEALTVVVPCHDEAGNIEPLAGALDAVRATDVPGLRVILVDDGSRDPTWEHIVAASDRHPELPLRGIRLASRSGQSAAIWTGLQEVDTPYAATMDADLQNDPADLPRLLGR